MKDLIKLFSVVLLFAMFTLQSCSDSDSSPSQTLVVGSMFNGQFYKVNTSTGTLTELFMPQYDGFDFNGVRAFVYHSAEKKYFVSTNRNSEWAGDLFTIDPATHEVTFLKDNDNGSGIKLWRQIPNWFVAKDGNLQAVIDPNTGNDGFIKISPTNGNYVGTIIEEERGMCCGYGMIRFSSDKQIIVANGNNQSNGSIDFSIYNEAFELQRGFTINKFIGFTEDIANDWWTIRSMASTSNSKSGAVYAVLVNSDSGDTYFVKVDFSKFTITRIADLDTTNDYDFGPLNFVPTKVAEQ